MTQNHRARKRFGQNFLTNEGVIHQIIASIAPRPNDNMVEIGPGLGALTDALLPELNHLNAIELDRDLAEKLEKQYGEQGKLQLYQQDVLQFQFNVLANAGPLRVVGNLPYNISTPLLFHLFKVIDCIKDMHFMLQQEVVSRMAAPVGSSNYNKLSVMVQYYCEVEQLIAIPPEAFDPAPKVNSGFLRLIPHTKRYDIDSRTLTEVVSLAFSQRRKTLNNTLKPLLNTEQIKQCDIDPGARAQELSVEKFVTLAQFVSTHRED
ncbi:MAG: 16S rRNA (adenine(1518)-N(6)/adenine(1519)-N(6))-dimethyltransferase RsmA [Coxiellaceae bacterium]|nr:16S rRNA (adenine(1518)-N(6)/adenine(1519)-N(6))-dimethyltransferase RsmA [Coxiellaceae bacterium]